MLPALSAILVATTSVLWSLRLTGTLSAWSADMVTSVELYWIVAAGAAVRSDDRAVSCWNHNALAVSCSAAGVRNEERRTVAFLVQSRLSTGQRKASHRQTAERLTLVR